MVFSLTKHIDESNCSFIVPSNNLVSTLNTQNNVKFGKILTLTVGLNLRADFFSILQNTTKVPKPMLIFDGIHNYFVIFRVEIRHRTANFPFRVLATFPLIFYGKWHLYRP